jgi:arylsulfatase A-like enzyme
MNFILAALFAAVVVLPCAAEPPRKPNLVIILTDDLGYADVACNGGKDVVTPNLDRLAAEGVRLTSFYATQGQCSPSRASLLTGCYANRIGINYVLSPASSIGLSAEEWNIAMMCKAGGYATGALGKWHLGDAPQFLPTSLGFDSWWGVPYSHDMWPVGYDGKTSAKKTWPPLNIMEGEQKLELVETLDDQAKLTRGITERAVTFIRDHKDGPFFLYVAHPMPHVPLAASAEFRGKSGKGLYADVIMEIDWSVGEIVSAIDAAGIGEHTLVVFTSDNGPWLNFGNHAGSAAPLREGKGSEWEGGVRVPAIARWKGVIPAGVVRPNIASTIDILPTFAAIADLQPPEKEIDGVDISALLRGDPSADPRQEFLFYYGTNLEAVRRGDWKLHLPHDYRNYEGLAPGRDGYPGPTRTGRTSYELYNLKDDVGERRNVADLHPDIVQSLRAVAEDAIKQLGHGKQAGTGQRPPGRIANPTP